MDLNKFALLILLIRSFIWRIISHFL